jgi:hypothetical protein
MFTRHFGVSPGKWRQRNGMNRISEPRRNVSADLRLPKIPAAPPQPNYAIRNAA